MICFRDNNGKCGGADEFEDEEIRGEGNFEEV